MNPNELKEIRRIYEEQLANGERVITLNALSFEALLVHAEEHNESKKERSSMKDRLIEWRERWNNGDTKFVPELFELVDELQKELEVFKEIAESCECNN